MAGRKPRIPFTSYQLARLAEELQKKKYISGKEKVQSALELDLTNTQVLNWFQHQRNCGHGKSKTNVKAESKTFSG